jgi:hypothetical protein
MASGDSPAIAPRSKPRSLWIDLQPHNEQSAKGKAEGIVSYSPRALFDADSACEPMRKVARVSGGAREVAGTAIAGAERDGHGAHPARPYCITAATGGAVPDKVCKQHIAPTIPPIYELFPGARVIVSHPWKLFRTIGQVFSLMCGFNYESQRISNFNGLTLTSKTQKKRDLVETILISLESGMVPDLADELPCCVCGGYRLGPLWR